MSWFFGFFCSRLTLFSFFCVYSNVLFAPSTNSSYFMWVQQCSSMHALHDIAYHCLDMIVKRYFSFVFLYACELQNYLAKTKIEKHFGLSLIFQDFIFEILSIDRTLTQFRKSKRFQHRFQISLKLFIMDHKMTMEFRYQAIK